MIFTCQMLGLTEKETLKVRSWKLACPSLRTSSCRVPKISRETRTVSCEEVSWLSSVRQKTKFIITERVERACGLKWGLKVSLEGEWERSQEIVGWCWQERRKVFWKRSSTYMFKWRLLNGIFCSYLWTQWCFGGCRIESFKPFVGAFNV